MKPFWTKPRFLRHFSAHHPYVSKLAYRTKAQNLPPFLSFFLRQTRALNQFDQACVALLRERLSLLGFCLPTVIETAKFLDDCDIKSPVSLECCDSMKINGGVA